MAYMTLMGEYGSPTHDELDPVLESQSVHGVHDPYVGVS
jgi:hypothetical protein